jgi:hypothetical protein
MDDQRAADVEERIWNELSYGLYGEQRDEALRDLDGLIEARRSSGSSADLIWALSLKIAVLRYEHERDGITQSTQVGEERLKLKREVLREHPSELRRALLEQASLYEFEGEPFERPRRRELEKEAAALAKRAKGGASGG